MKKKVGLYGGTFDPVHYGHLNLVLEIQEAWGFDEMWLVPTGINPFKINQTIASAVDRLEMTRLAAQDFPELLVLDLEVKREGVSYAIDTLHEIIPAYPDHEFAIVIGDDAARGFSRWKDVEEVIDLVPIYVGRRSCQKIIFELELLKQGYTETRILEISSTDIRDRLKRGLNCRHLLPPKVMDYITKTHLYS